MNDHYADRGVRHPGNRFTSLLLHRQRLFAGALAYSGYPEMKPNWPRMQHCGAAMERNSCADTAPFFFHDRLAILQGFLPGTGNSLAEGQENEKEATWSQCRCEA